MPARSPPSPNAPDHLARQLPRHELLRTTLLNELITLPAGVPLMRAAWNDASIFPQRVDRTHRFGPPAQCRRDGQFPFHWIYAADDAMTAVWEAGFCRNDVTNPGTFYFANGAREALLATLRFEVPLLLANLNGIALSKLGLFDDISNPDHERSQWLGCMIDAVIAAEDGRICGFRYPSRKHRGYDALALSSRSVARLRPRLALSVEPFGQSAAWAALADDACHAPPPG
jgi:hypothetical protein